MNVGAYLVQNEVKFMPTLQRLTKAMSNSDWTPTHPEGPYASDGWRVIKFIENGKPTAFYDRHKREIDEIVAEFKCPVHMLVLYSMLPGATLHPHRDVSATLELGRLRFHVPVVTHPDVDFLVSRKKVPMHEGQLWAINTSYLHAVNNRSDVDRIHLVLECEANDWVWSVLPRKDLRWYGHCLFFAGLLVGKGLRAALTDRERLRSYVHMGKFAVNQFGKSLGRKN